MTYDLPLARPDDAGAPPAPSTRLAGLRHAVRRTAALRRTPRRLAYVDTHFPWLRSGFRYDEAKALLDLRPDTMFFSLYGLTDPFPGRVHRLADFPSTAVAAGVTDVFAVFLNFTAALLGNAPEPAVSGVPGLRHDLSLRDVLDRHGMRLHATIYPGGGLLPTTTVPTIAAATAGATTVFTSRRDLAADLPGVVLTEVPADESFWTGGPAGRLRDRPLRVVLVADDQPRKGLATLLSAAAALPTGAIDLHVVGPHDRHATALAAVGATAHGWLDPEPLRDLLRTCHVVASPSSRDLPEDGYGDAGMIDGFPTTAAVVSMLSGCCLVASNPLGETDRLTAGEDYLEVPERDPAGLAAALLRLSGDDGLRLAVARRGAATARTTWAAEPVVRRRLQHVGLL